MRRLALPLALLLVLAGCSAFAGPSDPTPEPVTTPAPVPDGNGSVAGDLLAPGLAADGVVNASALARAHDRALENRSYALTVGSVGRYGNGTAFLRSQSRQVVAADGTYFLVREREDDRFRSAGRTRSVVWGNRTLAVRKTLLENGSNRTRVTPRPYPAGFRHLGPSLARMLDRANASLAGENDTGPTTRYLFAARGVDADDVPYGGVLQRGSGRLRAVVTETGFVRAVAGRATGRYGREGASARITFRVRYDGVGETTVPRPAWVDRALANHTRSRNVTVKGDSPTE